MAFNDTEVVQIKQCMNYFMEKRRPPKHIRDEHDLQYRIEDDSVIIFEVRQLSWSTGRAEEMLAKITNNRNSNSWSLFWSTDNNEWRHYDGRMIGSFSDAIKIIDEDEEHRFFG
ncbi:TPA: DUF3024 domain-containing protein [Morganella morganii]|uniref:DUF3024 domain-containing protein n=2 Tax=Morganella morganii TaxID=582 RepID=UPI001BD9F7F5|nr:DUF3024 domain-containing protein [Morganella morganii]MBT0380749.1 DUF3024 domain-containing protein [Morganella morganii subsp. morganii]HDU8609743.1 DUF3024 domain-containing protein [Morganella morganii]